MMEPSSGGRGVQSACVGAGGGLGSILRTLRGCGPGWGVNNLSALLSLCSVTVLVTVLTFLLRTCGRRLTRNREASFSPATCWAENPCWHTRL